MRLNTVDALQTVATFLTRQNVSRAVYAITGLLVVLLGLVTSFRSLAPTGKTLGPQETTPIVVQADVVIAETVRVCNPAGPGLPLTCAEKIVSKTFRQPFVRIHITYPTAVFEQDASEMRFALEKVADKIPAQNPPPDRVEVQVVSQSLSFAPKTVELTLGTETPRLMTFEAPKVDQVQKKLVLVQARLKNLPEAAVGPGSEAGFFDVGNLNVYVHPRQVLFGLTEATLKALQMLFSALGVPAIAVFVITFIANRYDKKNSSSKPTDEPKIIVPGSGDSRRTRR